MPKRPRLSKPKEVEGLAEAIIKRNFLKRCECAWDAGLCTPERLNILERMVNMVMRLETGQVVMALELLNQERDRLKSRWPAGTSTGGMGPGASDDDAYAAVQFTAILTHPCQLCGEDRRGWWTRTAFCAHDEK